jgi:hypothetical protein
MSILTCCPEEERTIEIENLPENFILDDIKPVSV